MASTPDDAVALVLLGPRDGLAYAGLHGETLVSHCLRALRRTPGVARVLGLLPAGTEGDVAHELGLDGLELLAERHWADWLHGLPPDLPLVLGDPLCPGSGPDLVGEVLGRVALGGGAAVAVRPVTDTVKTVVDGVVTGTLDREGLVSVVSPLAAPAGRLARTAGPGRPPPHDLAALAARLRLDGGIDLVPSPPAARRVGDVSAVRLLAALDED